MITPNHRSEADQTIRQKSSRDIIYKAGAEAALFFELIENNHSNRHLEGIPIDSPIRRYLRQHSKNKSIVTRKDLQVQVLNKRDKEHLVVKLHQEGETIREIAQQVHMSFKDIGSIIRKIDGKDDDSLQTKDLKNKSKDAQAFFSICYWKKAY